MIGEVAKTQDEEVGDGTTTAAVLAGELLNKAESLLDQKIHATTINRGYKYARERALEVLERIAEEVRPEDTETLLKIAKTAMTGKSSERASNHLEKLAVEAVKTVMERENGIEIDIDNIKIEK